GVPSLGIYQEVFNSDDPAWGGSGQANEGELAAEKEPWHGKEQSLQLKLPPLATIFLRKTKDHQEVEEKEG
ncbi:MAG TPA: 1,4-alpha-glucan branching enzyme, partial [Natronincola sp.]|nr:1,4-alpha-glucan branching enzyme [Natronincola sp.]